MTSRNTDDNLQRYTEIVTVFVLCMQKKLGLEHIGLTDPEVANRLLAVADNMLALQQGLNARSYAFAPKSLAISSAALLLIMRKGNHNHRKQGVRLLEKYFPEHLPIIWRALLPELTTTALRGLALERVQPTNVTRDILERPVHRASLVLLLEYHLARLLTEGGRNDDAFPHYHVIIRLLDGTGDDVPQWAQKILRTAKKVCARRNKTRLIKPYRPSPTKRKRASANSAHP